jgi:hypothetical protein
MPVLQRSLALMGALARCVVAGRIEAGFVGREGDTQVGLDWMVVLHNMCVAWSGWVGLGLGLGLVGF